MGRLLHSERLRAIHPRLRLFVVQLVEVGTYDWVVVTGMRSQADVDAKWALGRTQPGPHAGEPGFPPLGEVVTNVHTLEQAPHALRVTPDGVYGCAVDLQYLLPNGQLSPGETPEQQAVYRWLGENAEGAGFTWGGRFHHPFDQAHLELLDWRRYPLPRG